MTFKQFLIGCFMVIGLCLIGGCSNSSKELAGDAGSDDSMMENTIGIQGISKSQLDKQKALYATPTYTQALSKKHSYDLEVSVSWDSLQSLRDYGDRGVYEATTIGMHNGPSGYFGPQVFGNNGQNTRDMILFSFWDGKSQALPINDGIDGFCKRNCQDGNCKGKDNGTKCTLSYPMEDSVEYTMRLHRVKEKETIGSKSGSVWQVSVTNQHSNETKIVGKMLFVNVTQGVNRMNFFHEHIGETPCQAFHLKTYVKPKVLDSTNPMRSASGTVNGGAEYSCNSYDVSGDKGTQELVFETGGMIAPGFTRGQKHPLF